MPKSDLKERVICKLKQFKEYVEEQQREEKKTGESKGCFICFSQKTVNLIRLYRIRIILVVYASLSIVFTACAAFDEKFMYAFLAVALIIAETIYLTFWNDARDFYW